MSTLQVVFRFIRNSCIRNISGAGSTMVCVYVMALWSVSTIANATNAGTEFGPIDRQTRITNGVRTSVGQFPFLTAILSGREVTLNFEDGPSSARFFSGGVIAEFSGRMVDCGFAINVCLEVEDRICSIILDFPVDDHVPLTPAMQLQNCRQGGGIGAVFRPNSRNYFERLDLFDGNPRIPALYVYDDEGYQHLLLALAEGKLNISVTRTIPDEARCGGSYLGGRWVLTAGHCVVRKLNDGTFRVLHPDELLVNVGAYNLLNEKAFTQLVDEIHINDYQLADGWDENDYALLYLASDPQRGQAIGLASDENLDVGIASAAPALVVGWGSTEVREPIVPPSLTSLTSTTPLAATLRMQSSQSCSVLWRDFLLLGSTSRSIPSIRDIHLCAGSDIQQDTCQGDSGGPLMIDVNGELQVAGVTSFGLGCGGSVGLPGVYARVPSFRQWVLAKTGTVAGDQQEGRFLVNDTTANSTGNLPGSLSVESSPISGGGGFNGVAILCLLILFPRSSARLRYVLVTLLPLAVVAGCDAEQPVGDPGLISDAAETEPVGANTADGPESLNAVYGNGVISAIVVSTGCTLTEHFKVDYVVREGGDCDITINRVQADLCKRTAEAQSISIGWNKPAECSRVNIVNPSLTRD